MQAQGGFGRGSFPGLQTAALSSVSHPAFPRRGPEVPLFSLPLTIRAQSCGIWAPLNLIISLKAPSPNAVMLNFRGTQFRP